MNSLFIKRKKLFKLKLAMLLTSIFLYIGALAIFILSAVKTIELPLYVSGIILGLMLLNFVGGIISFVFSIVCLNDKWLLKGLFNAFTKMYYLTFINPLYWLLRFKMIKLVDEFKNNKPEGFLITTIKEIREVAWNNFMAMNKETLNNKD